MGVNRIESKRIGAREEEHEHLHVREVRQLDIRVGRGAARGLQLRLRQQRVVVERDVLRARDKLVIDARRVHPNRTRTRGN